MDSRTKTNQNLEQQLKEQQDGKLTDSLIFNIIKKIELKLTMEEKYETERIQIIKQIPKEYGRYIYTPYCIGYMTAAMGIMLFLRYKHRQPLKFQSILPHIIIAFTINQVARYQGIMSINPEMKEQYRLYQKTSTEIISQMKRRFSLIDYIKDTKIVTSQKLLKMLKYRPVH